MMAEEKEIIEGTDKTKQYKDFKAKQRGFKGNRRSRRGARGVPTQGKNDFEFWNQFPELMGIATRFPWMHIAGTPLDGTYVDVNLPNVAIQHFFSIPGTARNATDPLNLAFRQMYLDLHRKYRGVGAYAAADIAVTFICIESILQLIVEAERIYGILRGYPIKSRIEPEGLLLAMGYQPQFITTVKNHMADYRYSVNRLIDLAKRLPLPQGMSFFKNHVVLNGFIYRDSADERSGLLAFVCDNYYQYNTTNDPMCINNAGTAASMPIPRSSWFKAQDMFDLIENELTKLLSDSDILRITSDFIACYGENNMQVLTPLPEDYAVLPAYSESILHKWHNSERYPIYGDNNTSHALTYELYVAGQTQLATPTFCVYQQTPMASTDLIVSAPVISRLGNNTWQQTYGGKSWVWSETGQQAFIPYEMNYDKINDSWMSEPSQEFICESVLWKRDLANILSTGAANLANRIVTCGTEILTILNVYAVSNSVIMDTCTYEYGILAHDSDTVADGLIHFDWHPYVLVINPSGTVTNIIGDTDNVTVVSKDVVRKVLDAANLSAFKITVSGGSSRE